MLRTSLLRRIGIGIVVGAFATHLASTRGNNGTAVVAALGQDQSGEGSSHVDVARLMRDVERLSSPDFEGRLTGSPGSQRAQAFILDRFRELGLEPVVRGGDGLSYEQPFSFTYVSNAGGRNGRPLRREFPGATNLMGSIEGSVEPARFTTLTSHYDHLGVRDGRTYPGADDDASGVAAMLAAAEYFTQHRPRRSILFVAFDGEEQGLQGSKFFIANPPIALDRIVLEVNLDMVARGDRRELVAAGTWFSPELKDRLLATARGRSLKLVLGHDRPSGARAEDWTGASDHGPFHAAGVPFLYFGVENHSDYHRPTDTADKIPREFFAEAANLIVDVLLAFDR